MVRRVHAVLSGFRTSIRAVDLNDTYFCERRFSRWVPRGSRMLKACAPVCSSR